MPALANGASKTNAQTADAQPGRIRQWLNKAGLVKYFDGFNKLTESQFASLMMQDYPKHGVSDMADKQKLFRLLKTVNAQENIAAPPTAANVAPAEKTPNVAARATAPADDLEPLLVSPADEDLLSEAVGLAGDVLATPGGLLDVHGGEDDADDDLLGDVDIDPANDDGEAADADADANAMPRLCRNADDEDDEEKAIAAETTIATLAIAERALDGEPEQLVFYLVGGRAGRHVLGPRANQNSRIKRKLTTSRNSSFSHIHTPIHSMFTCSNRPWLEPMPYSHQPSTHEHLWNRVR